MAAINLALTNTLTDKIPECMSEVVGKWIIRVQDEIPDEIRNSPEWKRLLPLAAGTGRDREEERLAVIMGWMWGTVLPSLQDVADDGGFGVEWTRMTEERTKAASAAAWAAADAATAAASAARAAYATALAARDAAWAAEAAAEAAASAASAAAWETFDPVGVLTRLVAVGV